MDGVAGNAKGDRMKQYCRYCAYCFEADDFRCSHHPEGKEPHWTRKQINRENHCPNFELSDLGDVETGKKYMPHRAKTETETMIDRNQVSLFGQAWE